MMPEGKQEEQGRDPADLSRWAFYTGQWFLVIMAALGVSLRYALVAPISGFNYGHFLHAHSHLGFWGSRYIASCRGVSGPDFGLFLSSPRLACWEC